MQASQKVGERQAQLAFGRPDIDTLASEKLFYGVSLRLNNDYSSEPLRKYVQREIFGQVRKEMPDASILPSIGREATSTLSVINKGVNIVEVYLFDKHDGGRLLKMVTHAHGAPIMKGVAYALQNVASRLEHTSERELIVLMNLSSRLPELEVHENFARM
ncbi:MAG: hypothetical protein KGH66_00560 [Candidatus Micrarchaeota archaeon]|nr:hypothetical protein [Candidatus Micrarchaeota archaeon]